MPHVIGGRYGLSSKEFTPAMAKAAFDELKVGDSPERISPSASTTTSATRACRSTQASWSSRTTSRARCSTASVRTARSAPTRTASKSSPRTPDCTRKAISFTTSHKSGAQTVSHLRFGPEPIHAPYLIAQAELRRVPSVHGAGAAGPVERRRTRRDRAAERPMAGGGSLGPPAAPGAAKPSSRGSCGCSSSMPSAVAREVGSRRPHQHRPADLLFRDLRRAAARRGDRPHQGRDQENLRRKGPGGRSTGTSPRSMAPWRDCTKSKVPAARHQH